MIDESVLALLKVQKRPTTAERLAPQLTAKTCEVTAALKRLELAGDAHGTYELAGRMWVANGDECDRCGAARPLEYFPEYGASFCQPCGADPQAT